MEITIDKEGRYSRIFHSKLCAEPFKLFVPEFRGESSGEAFAIQQALHWKKGNPGGGQAEFELQGDTREVAIEFKGALQAKKHEIAVFANVQNVTPNPMHSANHALLLDMKESTAFHDPTGERTFLYAETGWVTQAQLLNQAVTRKHTILMGASYRAITVTWAMIARFDVMKKTCIALALDRGYAFAGDHPEWGPGLLGGYRWGSIASMETKKLAGKIYLFKGTLNDLRLKYVNDFK